ncbi:hypothetical protein GPROT2_03128 [Gammaproteobacteria bacterium]|nr:BamA/TamA family outer membrane protein [Gammaproteobacteria bacterium]QOJ32714.1 MAG: BamA/TamA family outer membrane protein [Gammaproteobacteria bacterium]CAG0945270.1 hypothetical protein GPROT2_03128 [Gammaproteobacteria bacterium]
MDAIPRSWRRQWLVTWWLVLAALAGPAAWAGDEADTDAEPVTRGQDMPSPEELERRGATIGRIDIEVGDIFDTSDPREDRMLYRLANDLHYSTRPSTVQDQLLLQPGDLFSAERAAETARLLREQEYFSDADVLARHYDPDTNTVDLDVKVHDVWTLEPGIGVGRSGGTNRSRLRLADSNFLGLGQQLAVEYKSNVDRSGLGVQFIDPQLFHSRWATQAHYTDTSDGRLGSFVLERPFFALDSRWSAGVAANAIDEVTPVYESGEKVSEFGSSYRDYSVQGGTSRGLVDGWARRWLAGYRYASARYQAVTDGDTPTRELPQDYTLSYPWVGVELIEDHFETSRNRDQIGRTEDVFLGRRLRASLGWSAPAFGADRSAGIFSLLGSMGLPFGQGNDLHLSSGWEGRLESGGLVDAVLQADSRFYHRFDEHNTFMAYFAGAHGDGLSEDHPLQLGGDNGLRGYPLRYETGENRVLLTVEERYYTDWYPFRLFRVGAAVFADAGQAWGGDDPAAADAATPPPTGWLGDVGFGLRIGNARSGIGSVLHVDLAFPVAPPGDVSKVQLLLQAEKSF